MVYSKIILGGLIVVLLVSIGIGAGIISYNASHTPECVAKEYPGGQAVDPKSHFFQGSISVEFTDKATKKQIKDLICNSGLTYTNKYNDESLRRLSIIVPIGKEESWIEELKKSTIVKNAERELGGWTD